MSAPAPSGEQFEIVYGEQRAVIVEVGGGIREYSVGGRDVLDPYPPGAICDGARGAPLIPWPNRLADGRYSFDGEEHQLALSEPERGNAIHGLLRWRPWQQLARTAAAVTVGARLHPSPGYPFALDACIAYELSEDGLTVTTAATNIGQRSCPYAAGQHPYLSPGDGTIDDCTLELPACARILTDEARKLPCGIESVEDTSFDFRAARRLGGQEIDSAFADLARDEHGRATVTLARPDRKSVELWVRRRTQRGASAQRPRRGADDVSAQRARNRRGHCRAAARPTAYRALGSSPALTETLKYAPDHHESAAANDRRRGRHLRRRPGVAR
jgi:aldose 1-epimerase